jgi:hypothetical protein
MTFSSAMFRKGLLLNLYQYLYVVDIGIKVG